MTLRFAMPQRMRATSNQALCVSAALLAVGLSLFVAVQTLLLMILSISLLVASIWDWTTHRIPNWICYPAAVAVISVLALAPSGTALQQLPIVSNIAEAILGGMSCFAIAFAIWIYGGFGGGDVKLTMLIGMVLGAQFGLAVFLTTQLLAASYLLWSHAIDAWRLGWRNVPRMQPLPMAGFYTLACLIVTLKVYLS